MLKVSENLIKLFFFVDLLKGLYVTFKKLFKKKITVMYPEEKIPKSVRFRGLHALRRYSNGTERCIACKLCESICPSMAITIDSKPSYDGVRTAVRYEIDLFKCVYCGLCEEACPVSSIIQTTISDFCFENYNSRVIYKNELLFIGTSFENEIVLSINGRFV